MLHRRVIPVDGTGVEILARAAEQPVASEAGLVIVIVVGAVVTLLTAMSRNVANGRTGNRHLRRAERIGREDMESALHDAVTRRLAELPPEPRPKRSIDLRAPIDLTSERDEQAPDVDLAAAEDTAAIEPGGPPPDESEPTD